VKQAVRQLSPLMHHSEWRYRPRCLVGLTHPQREVTFEEAQDLAESFKASYFEVCPVGGFNCDNMLHQLVQEIVGARTSYKENLIEDRKRIFNAHMKFIRLTISFIALLFVAEILTLVTLFAAFSYLISGDLRECNFEVRYYNLPPWASLFVLMVCLVIPSASRPMRIIQSVSICLLISISLIGAVLLPYMTYSDLLCPLYLEIAYLFIIGSLAFFLLFSLGYLFAQRL